MQIIDTHIHIWDLENITYQWLEGNETLLNRTYKLAELEEQRKEAGITCGVLVQAENHFQDTDWMLSNAMQADWIRGVVGWVPLMQPDETQAALDKYLKHPYFKGVRHLIHDEPDPKWLLQAEVLESLKILAAHKVPYDVVGVLADHIECALVVAEKIPHLNMVFDHLNQPPIAQKEMFGRWGELMIEAAKHDNLFQKISGLGTTTGNLEGWATDDIQPYVEFVLEHFGTDRCFCGGDWPVSRLAGEYARTWGIYKKLLTRILSTEGQEKVFYRNANTFYKLSV
ncbi:MAG: amidohydrolase family protein [Phaeodactylibacter sp.]|nr:amidohydrolase family protein [Phaeodactylibacter sp.]